jgi:hypothetical protein
LRKIEATDREIDKYLNKLEKFLGVHNVEKRIKQIERAVEIETGFIYRQYWLYPQSEWWLGLRDLRRLRASGKVLHVPNRVTTQMRKCLDTAVKLALLYREMPQSTRDDFKQRLLSDGSIAPILTEINAAAHLWPELFITLKIDRRKDF